MRGVPLGPDQSRDLANAFQSGGGDAVPVAKTVLQTLKPENNLLLCAIVQLFDMIVSSNERAASSLSNGGVISMHASVCTGVRVFMWVHACICCVLYKH